MELIPAAFGAAFSLTAVTPLHFADVLTIPYGDMLASVVSYIGTILLAVIMWALRFLPAQLYSILMTVRAEQLLTRAIVFGMNSVKGAAPGKTVTIDIANPVLREALSYALLHGGSIVKRFLGEPEAVAEKLWSRLPVDAETPKPNFGALAVETVVAIETRQPERAEKAGISVL